MDRSIGAAAVFLVVVTVGLHGADPAVRQQVRACTRAAQRVQDEARILRNGATAGADRAALSRELTLITRAIDDLEGAEARWLEALTPDAKIQLTAQIAGMAADRRELRKHLDELSAALAASAPRRDDIRLIARAIARHAWAWETAVRAGAARI